MTRGFFARIRRWVVGLGIVGATLCAVLPVRGCFPRFEDGGVSLIETRLD
jgi:hypothetical protein